MTPNVLSKLRACAAATQPARPADTVAKRQAAKTARPASARLESGAAA